MKYETIKVVSPSENQAALDKVFPGGIPADDWRVVGLDTEYERIGNNKYVLYYMQFYNGKTCYVIDGPGTSAARGSKLDLLADWAEWIHCAKVKKRLSTMGAEYRSLMQYAELRGVQIDTEVGDWFWDENRNEHGLKASAADHCGLDMHDYGEVFGYIPEGKKKAYVPSMREIVWGNDKFPYMPWTGEEGRAKAEDYAGLDPVASYELGSKQLEKLEELDLLEWYKEVERPFTATLLKIEDRGVGINVKLLREAQRKCRDAIQRKRHVFRALVDKPGLNLSSSNQLKELFFDELGWKVVKKSKKTRAPSLDKEAMQIYADSDYELAKALLDYRVDKHNDSNFISPMLRNLRMGEWGVPVLHTKFWQARVVTGRLSSGSKKEGLMNLQNIPASEEKDPYLVRTFYIPTRKGWVLIVGDFSQIELYILAEMSQDTDMCRAFNNNEDLHILTACKVWGLDYPGSNKSKQEEFKERYAKERKKAKILNFSINYGISAVTLCQRLKVSEEEAEQYMAAYFDLYKGVRAWLDNQIATAHAVGYVKTMGGYRRRLEGINSTDSGMREHAERQAMNAPIQGTASQIIKVAMNALEYGAKYRSKWLDYVPEVARLTLHGTEQLLQVHDEIALQTPAKYAEEDTAIVKKVMESAFKNQFSHVVVKASVHHGLNWSEGKQ